MGEWSFQFITTTLLEHANNQYWNMQTIITCITSFDKGNLVKLIPFIFIFTLSLICVNWSTGSLVVGLNEYQNNHLLLIKLI